MAVSVGTPDYWKLKSNINSNHSNKNNYFICNVCRICSNISDHVIPIFDKVQGKGSLFNKLKKCVPSILIQETDIKPKQICMSCVSKLEICFAFIEMSLDSDYKFDSVLQNKIHADEMQVNNRVFMWNDTAVKSGSVTVNGQQQCTQNTQQLQEELQQKFILQQQPTIQQNPILMLNKASDINHNVYQSIVAPQDGSSSQDVLVVVEWKYKNYPNTTGTVYSAFRRSDAEVLAEENSLKNNNNDDSNVVQNLKNKTIECFQSKSETCIRNGINSETNILNDATIKLQDENNLAIKKMENLSCNMPLNSSTMFKALENEFINNSIKLDGLTEADDIANLNYSGISFNGQYGRKLMETDTVEISANNHNNTINTAAVKDTVSSSPLNNRTTNDSSQLQRDFACPICGKQFTRRNRLTAHIARHSSIRPHSCDKCDQTFITRWDLTLHLRIHSRIFSCEFCSKAFPAKGKLERHRRTHTGERPYPCQHCDKAFSEKRNLENHIRTHTGERPFVCTDCGRSFHVRTHLTDHRLVHNGNLVKLKCGPCDKSCKWKTNYNLHLKGHTINSSASTNIVSTVDASDHSHISNASYSDNESVSVNMGSDPNNNEQSIDPAVLFA